MAGPRQALIKESDIKRCIKAFEKSGVGFAGIKIDPDGTIYLQSGTPKAGQSNSLDEILGL